MGLFGRRARGMLPKGMREKIELYGRHEWAVPESPYDPSEIWQSVLQPLHQPAAADPCAFVDELAPEVSPHGGWAAYGAEHLMFDLVSSNAPKCPSFGTVMDAALDFLRSNNVPPMRVTGHEWNYWIDSGGTIDSWVPRLPIPDRAATILTELREGETRRIAQLTSAPGSNVILARREPNGEYVSLIDAAWSSDDPTRSVSEHQRAATLYDLYTEVALSLQSPTHWFDPELGPFFPLPPCTL